MMLELLVAYTIFFLFIFIVIPSLIFLLMIIAYPNSYIDDFRSSFLRKYVRDIREEKDFARLYSFFQNSKKEYMLLSKLPWFKHKAYYWRNIESEMYDLKDKLTKRK